MSRAARVSAAGGKEGEEELVVEGGVFIHAGGAMVPGEPRGGHGDGDRGGSVFTVATGGRC